ncbi:phage minor head protein [Salipaludibacillus sp. CF4.18]|uniref:phage minor head protein n=1 Tax=Salipaludibacillus sp. CF4.18 TaxID=3373081 RepID=UPI003EE48FAE
MMVATKEEQNRLRDLALDQLESEFEKELIRNFQTALKEIRGKLAIAYEKTDGSWIEMQRYNRLTKLEKDIGDEVRKLTGRNALTLQKSQRQLFEESYYRSAYILSNEVKSDLGFSVLNRELIDRGIENPLDRVGFLQRNRDNQSRLTRQMREQLTQGLLQGEAYGTTAKRLKKRMDIGARNALTIAQTENHRVRGKARLDVMEEGKELGITLKKHWLSTVDGSTRDSHANADGQEVDIDKPFKVDGEKLMYPGDPAGSAENVIKCRCTMIEIVAGFEPKYRRVRDVGITEYKTYNEYLEKGLIKS